MTNEELQQRIALLESENASLRETLRLREGLIRSTFGRYLTDEVLEDILQHQDAPPTTGELRTVTMMFSDLRSSTALSEQMNARDFIRMLNHFYAEMIEIINAWRGNILEFVGDEIVAVFGAPRPNDDAAAEAVACAVAMQRRMGAVNEWNRSEGYPEIAMGIGIHTGEAVLGTIGSETRSKYDMIGRNVNLASRIQGFTSGGQIYISGETLAAAGEAVRINPAGERWVQPKGIEESILLHEVAGYGRSAVPGFENLPKSVEEGEKL
ncbi:MAG: adenylate/guanylate cyclase domain-containing protein [Clostridia bacterium]|nr:adenylate/guanylate cyclase domain-containing protein [Clostridia bacterium]